EAYAPGPAGDGLVTTAALGLPARSAFGAVYPRQAPVCRAAACRTLERFRCRQVLFRLSEGLEQRLRPLVGGAQGMEPERRLALRLEQLGIADHDTGALRARRGDVEPVEAVEELHAVRGVGGARGRHGIDDHRRLLPLEPVHRADARLRESRAEIGDLRVVRRDDQDVIEL